MINRNPFSTVSPYEEVELARRKRLILGTVQRAMSYGILLALGLLALLIYRFSSQLFVATLLCIGIIPNLILVRRLANAGKQDLAAYIMLSYLMFTTGVNALVIDGFYPILVPGFLILIADSGMILKPRRSLIVAFIATLFYLLSQTLRFGVILPIQLQGPWAFLIAVGVVIIAFFFVARTMEMASEDLRRSLDDATVQLMEANRKLEQASERKSQFTARTSHELRTPLSAMIVFTDLALRGAYGPLNEKLENALVHVINSARHLKTIINDILDLSKIEAGELEIVEEQVEIRSLVVAAEAGCLEANESKGLNCSIILAEDMPKYICGDESRLTQILLNLVGNAVKFTKEGQVEVRIEPHGEDQWRLLVRDSGPGIPEDQFEAIFQAYRQLDNLGREARAKGTGLGLAITRHLVDSMGGEISVCSELGKGSTFEVILPLIKYMPEETTLDQQAIGC
jgi:signal transduction histidine kinase